MAGAATARAANVNINYSTNQPIPEQASSKAELAAPTVNQPAIVLTYRRARLRVPNGRVGHVKIGFDPYAPIWSQMFCVPPTVEASIDCRARTVVGRVT